MTIRLDQDQADLLETVALVDDKPVSDVIRAAITAHIQHRQQDQGFRDGLRQRIQRAERLLGEP